jgi:hypothetical protein
MTISTMVSSTTVSAAMVSIMSSPLYFFPSARISHIFHGMMDSFHHRPNGCREFGIPDVLSERKNILDIMYH